MPLAFFRGRLSARLGDADLRISNEKSQIRSATRLQPAPVHASVPNLDVGIADLLGCAGVKERHQKLFGVELEACRQSDLRLDECATGADLSAQCTRALEGRPANALAGLDSSWRRSVPLFERVQHPSPPALHVACAG